MNVKTIVQGFGAAILVMILRVWPHLSRYHPVIYHSFLPMRSVVWGVLIDLGAITLLAALLFGYLEKSETGLRTVVWAFVAAELASALVNALAGMRRAPIPYLSAGRAYVITLLFSLALRWLWPPTYRHAVRGFGVLLALAGCSMVWMIPQLLYQGLRPQRADAVVPLSHLPPVSDRAGPAADPERIVWLLFDELSFDQTFEHRFHGLALPAFDSLKSKSVVFSNLQPAGYYTDRVVPSYFLGVQVKNIRSSLDGDPTINLAGKSWQAFDANATIFADAQRQGWTTGVVGWYNPYCRILAGTLNYCYWRMGDGQSDGALPEHSALQNAFMPLVGRVRDLDHRANLRPDEAGAGHGSAHAPGRGVASRREYRFRFYSSPHTAPSRNIRPDQRTRACRRQLYRQPGTGRQIFGRDDGDPQHNRFGLQDHRHRLLGPLLARAHVAVNCDVDKGR